jgi:guanine deaminase
MSEPTLDDVDFLQQAVDLAVDNVGQGGGPFGAVIVRAGEVIATGVNRVTSELDPTAHAEVQAIRAAAKAIGDFSLVGCTLYTSCEPCPMCLASSLWARVDRVVFAADRHDAAAGGFDDLEFYELFARDRSTWETSVEALALDRPAAPFDAWRSKTDRVDY